MSPSLAKGGDGKDDSASSTALSRGWRRCTALRFIHNLGARWSSRRACSTITRLVRLLSSCHVRHPKIHFPSQLPPLNQFTLMRAQMWTHTWTCATRPSRPTEVVRPCGLSLDLRRSRGSPSSQRRVALAARGFPVAGRVAAPLDGPERLQRRDGLS